MEPVGSRGIFDDAKRLIAAFSALLLLCGCEEKPLYSRIMVPGAVVMPVCLSATAEGMETSGVSGAFSDAGVPLDPTCDSRVHITKTRAGCALEKQKSAASAGVVRLEIFMGNRTVYQVQQEFWDESDRELLGRLISRMKEDLSAKRP